MSKELSLIIMLAFLSGAPVWIAHWVFNKVSGFPFWISLLIHLVLTFGGYSIVKIFI